MTRKYDDIIHLPRHVSKMRPKMSVIDRAAQFSPFAALTGHSTAIEETARLTEERVELDEYMKEVLNDKLQIIVNHLKEKQEIVITYFKPDEKKDGGAYITAIGTVKKINKYERALIMADDTKIPIDEIISIEGEIFEDLYDQQ